MHVPADRTVYTGDILLLAAIQLFGKGRCKTGLTRESHYRYGCRDDYSGHGPITTKAGVEEVRHYLVTMKRRARVMRGMSYKEAAFDIALGVFDDWGDRERIVVNCATMFHEFGAQENLKCRTVRRHGRICDRATARKRS